MNIPREDGKVGGRERRRESQRLDAELYRSLFSSVGA